MRRLFPCFSQRGHIACFGSAACIAGEASRASTSCESNQTGREPAPRNLYLHAAEARPDLVGNGPQMRQAYIEQVSMAAREALPLPSHISACNQCPAGQGRNVVVRVAQWNINCLCGADGYTPQGASLLLEAIATWNADVILLQEAPIGPPDAHWPEPWKSLFPTEAMRNLEVGLKELGYSVQLRTHVGNSTLLCSKLKLEEDGKMKSISLDDGHVFRHCPHVMMEERAALLANLRLDMLIGTGGAPLLSVYATHLHHNNATEGRAGVREAEAIALLQHWWSNVPCRARCGVLATDFNQARRQDYSEREWAVISAGLAKPWVRQPEDDGVSDLLTHAGWVCAYDSPSAARNWHGNGAPSLTHWTGTTVDFPYISPLGGSVEIKGVYLVYSSLSDHLPIVTDIAVAL